MTDVATIGHNQGPEDPAAVLRERLAETHDKLLARKDELLGMEARLPAACTDEDTAAKLADAIKACTAFTKNSEATRTAEKEPFLAAGRTVDGFFKSQSDPVDKLKTKMGAMLTAYQREVADKERRRLEAIAAEERRIQKEAEAKAREEARLVREAQEAEERKAEEARKAIEALGAAARKKAEEQERIRAAEAAAEIKRQEEAAAKARDEAREAKQDANVAKQDAGAKAADLSRSRSTAGSVASLRVTWDFEVKDESLVPREYLGVKESAIRVAIKAATTPDNKCSLRIPGVKIFAKEESIVR
jgi:DNA repair exonuclease SbcCD ATPase subunit